MISFPFTRRQLEKPAWMGHVCKLGSKTVQEVLGNHWLWKINRV